jgi:transcriptional regulator with XRE-family HTH domain
MKKMEEPLIPAQIRAGRALLGWSQQELADAAEVGLTTVRDYENERRAGQVGGLKSIREALVNAGVVFMKGEPKGNLGPGVRLIAQMPSVLRAPVKLGAFDNLVFPVEWRGQEIVVVVSHAALQDLGKFRGNRAERDYLALFEKKRGEILLAAGAAIDSGSVTPDGRVHLRSQDFPSSR